MTAVATRTTTPGRTSAPEFSSQLRALVHETLAQSESADPRVVAEGVIERLARAQYADALRVVLVDWVRIECSNFARRGRASARAGSLTTPDRVRTWYAQQLGSALFVGDGWKFLRDCTADDLHTAATDRYRKASETHAEGDRLTKIALFMEEHDRETVELIGEDELKTLMEAS